jgi:glutathione peroxidase
MQTRTLAFLAILLAAVPGGAAEMPKTAYDFSFVSIDGGSLPLSEFRGNVIMVVNTASFCGYTPQYTGLQKLWERYRGRGFVMVGVPSNDFGAQEPGTNSEIKHFCTVSFDVNFPMTEKVKVRGDEAHPFYKWAAATLGDEARPRWNFHKYLVGRDGRLVGWFPTATEPSAPEVAKAIEAALGAGG